jgi:hypothetical protein
MNDPTPITPRRRLQTLLAIPDSQRTEAEWDEIIELEISLAPGNRLDTPERPQNSERAQNPGRHQNAGQGHGQGQGHKAKPNSGPKGGKPSRKGRGKPPPKVNTP